MAYQPVLGTAEVRMEYILNGENCENVYHVANDSGEAFTLTQLLDIGGAFADWEDASAKPQRTTACALHNITVTDLTSLTSDRVTIPVVPPIAGTQGGDSQANNVTLACKADVHNRGRGKNGRTFWIGLSEGQTNGSNITSAARDAIVLALNAIITDIEAVNPTYRLVIVHRVVGHVHPPVAGTSQVFLYSVTDDTLDSQKNRLPNHRRKHVRALR